MIPMKQGTNGLDFGPGYSIVGDHDIVAETCVCVGLNSPPK